MAEFSRGVENTVEKKRNFSFSHSVFKRLILQTRKSKSLFGKSLPNDKILDQYNQLNNVESTINPLLHNDNI